ncbi:hypothetical protein [Paenibacillus elgii]|uniref:hypothetical protein n=1 Tax=Paenibacillus elgii TaxID=189691 RepID=UPI000248D3B8|nr:hypothetical protein [Paenibacillus elgii]
MNEQQIRDMKPGPEMDRTLGLALGYEEILVHEDLERRQKSEHERGTIIRYGIRYILRRKDQPAVEWSPSTTWEGMGLVIEEMQNRWLQVFTTHYHDGTTDAQVVREAMETLGDAQSKEAPHAVAKAALLALLALRGGEQR